MLQQKSTLDPFGDVPRVPQNLISPPSGTHVNLILQTTSSCDSSHAYPRHINNCYQDLFFPMNSQSPPSPPSSRMSTTQPQPKPDGRKIRKLARTACDGCKIRKIKCSEKPPCDGCRAVGLSCTFNKRPATRGPRKLRTSTIQEIAQAQQQKEARPESSDASYDLK